MPPYQNALLGQLDEESGLHPKLDEAFDLRPADGQFARLMERLGIEHPAYVKAAAPDFVLPPGTARRTSPPRAPGGLVQPGVPSRVGDAVPGRAAGTPAGAAGPTGAGDDSPSVHGGVGR